jgi:hypothetical protein
VGKVGKRVGGPPAGWVWLPRNGAAVDPKNPKAEPPEFHWSRGDPLRKNPLFQLPMPGATVLSVGQVGPLVAPRIVAPRIVAGRLQPDTPEDLVAVQLGPLDSQTQVVFQQFLDLPLGEGFAALRIGDAAG